MLSSELARHRERHVDRRHLVHHDQRRRAAGLNQVAFVHLQRAGAAGRGRQDRRVLQVRSRPPPRRRGRRRSSPSGPRRWPPASRTARAAISPRSSRFLSRTTCAWALSACAVSRASAAVGLVERDLERLRVEGEEELARLDLLPFGEVHLREPARHLRSHLHGGDGLDGADRRFRDGHRLGDRRRGHDRTGPPSPPRPPRPRPAAGAPPGLA